MKNLRPGTPSGSTLGGICTDGRELFIAVGAQIWAYDPVSGNRRVVASMSNIIGLDLDVGGDLRCVLSSGLIYRVPVHGGGATLLISGGFFPWLTIHGQTQTYAAYNPWTGKTVISGMAYGSSPLGWFPSSWGFLYEYDDATGVWTQVSAGFESGGPVEAVAPVPFALFGRECANGLGSGARMGFDGLPEPGGSFALTVRDAQPNGFAFSWLGFSHTHWPGVGPLPWQPVGAPGCEVLVSVDAVRMLLVDANGEAAATYQVPNLPGFAGLELFGQWAASAPGSALGLSSSDAVAIELR